MNFFTKTKMLTLAAGMMLATSANATIASNKVSSGDLVISKVFYSAAKNASGSGNYVAGQYIEIYNNCEEEVEISGMYVALVESESATSAYTQAVIEADADLKSMLGGKIVVKQIFQIPTDKTYTIGAGKSVIICNSATDHTAEAATGHNLSGADFEVKTTNTKYPHNDAVPAMTLVYTMNPSLDFMNLSYTGTGAAGVVLLKNNASAIVTAEDKLVYGYNKTSGNMFALVNPYYAIDAVEILGNVKNNGVDETLKRMNDTSDAGYATTATAGGYTGETVYRKTAFILPDGRKVLYDTNNSSVDFQASATIQPRAFDEEKAGLTEETITIPESGFLVFRPEKSVFGDENLTFTYITANAKNTDLAYNEYKGNAELLASSNFIVVGTPGTHKVYYSEAQPTKKIPNNSLNWSEEDSKEFTSTNQKNRIIYKWVNTAEKTGFKRVPKTGEGLYNYAEFSGDDRLYLYITPAMATAFYEANGADSADDLDFLTWHGTTPDLSPSGVQAVSAARMSATGAIYRLNGNRTNRMQKGNVYIVDGRKTMWP